MNSLNPSEIRSPAVIKVNTNFTPEQVAKWSGVVAAYIEMRDQFKDFFKTYKHAPYNEQP